MSSAEFIESLGFKPDGFQLEAIAAIDTGSNVIVSAPTGSGKTLVAEYGIYRYASGAERVFYTTPIKALSNQKYRDLCQTHGPNRVGLLTGDIQINPGADIVVMTTEVLRNMIYGQAPDERLRCVILDEVHYLQDEFRGAVWEEVIIHLDKAVQLICLSATVSNADELADWIGAVRGTSQLITSAVRPIALESYYFVAERGASRVHMTKIAKKNKPNPKGFEYDIDFKDRGHRSNGRRRRNRKHFTPRLVELVTELKRREMLPAIYFKFSRAGCSDAARELAQSGMSLTSSEEARRIEAIAMEVTSGLSETDKVALDQEGFVKTLSSGFAPHHAGLIVPFKDAVERCFTEGLLKVVFATETLALGINMPARTVVIDKLTKYNGETHEYLTPAQFTQLTGRAGRRGIDTVGYAGVMWSPFVGFSDVADVAMSSDYELISSFRLNYNMAANLMANYDENTATALLGDSFAQFQVEVDIKGIHADVERLESRLKSLRGDDKSTRKRRSKIVKKIEAATEEIQQSRHSIVEELGGVIAVMEEFGYALNWKLSRKGQLMSRIYHESDLLIAECIGSGVLDGLNPAELSGALSVFCYEERRKDVEHSGWIPSENLNRSVTQIEVIHKKLRAREKAHGVDITSEPDVGFVAAAHGWTAGGSLADVLDSEEMVAGDFVRTIRKVGDLLAQLSSWGEGEEISKVAKHALAQVDRGLIAASMAVEAVDPIEPPDGTKPYHGDSSDQPES